MRRDKQPPSQQDKATPQQPRVEQSSRPLVPIPNYSLSTTCPACTTPTYRHACKVRCPRCGFAWDCSEL